MDESNKRYGVVIGVSDYHPDDQMKSLPYARNDANEVYRTLIEHCNFEEDRLYLFADESSEGPQVRARKPVRADVLHAINHVAERAKQGDLLFVYVAGHGFEVSRQPYLVMSDTRMNVIRQTAIDVNDLNRVLESSDANCILRVFDACRAPFAVARSAAERMTDGFQNALLHTAVGWATLSACSSGEVSYDASEYERGAFSHYLCEGLRGKAATENGDVTLESLVNYVKISVANWADRQSLRQTPNFQSDISGVMVLSRVPKPMVSAPIPVSHPLAALSIGIQEHLARAEADARHLNFTNPEEFVQFSTIFGNCVQNIVADFRDPVISVSAGEPTGLTQQMRRIWQPFVGRMQERGVQGEFSSEATAVTVSFESRELLVCASRLVIVAARFSFFYWLFYMHDCEASKGQSGFEPQQKRRAGSITFKPVAAVDSSKVEAALREIFSRATEATLDWSSDLSKFVSNRIAPLRRDDTIVE